MRDFIFTLYTLKVRMNFRQKKNFLRVLIFALKRPSLYLFPGIQIKTKKFLLNIVLKINATFFQG